MISFRYHVVSIAAVLLALAAGVALGGGPLSEIGRGGDAAVERAQAQVDQLDSRLEQAQGTAAFQDTVALTAGSRALQGRLNGRSVAVLSFPGVEDDVVAGLTELVAQAGGSVAGTYAVQPGLVAADGKSLVDTLGSQILENTPDTGIPPDATTYDRMGQLIGGAVATQEDAGAPPTAATSDILSSLRGAELLIRSGGGDQRASLVLLVLGDQPVDEEGLENIYGGLATGVATQADGVVVAGTTASASGGLLRLLRDEVSFTSNVSSVDSVQTAAGRLATVLAVAASTGDEPGHYGAQGIDGALPRG